MILCITKKQNYCIKLLKEKNHIFISPRRQNLKLTLQPVHLVQFYLKCSCSRVSSASPSPGKIEFFPCPEQL